MFGSRCTIAGGLVVGLALSLQARGAGDEAPAAKKDAKSKEKWLVDRALTVSPAPAAVPALKYRLYPLAVERKPGNAVPIYLRLVHEQNDASRQRWRETPQKWNELPVDKIPIAEARHFLYDYRRFFQQFDLAARRTHAEWNYTLDQGNVIDILLPDIQNMRGYMPMMVLRARVALAEGRFTDAAHDLETGFSFSRQIAEAPFLISGLVAIAGGSLFESVLLDWVEQPGAPNVFWSLAVLPRPFIDLRYGTEFEERFMEMQFPDLANLDQERTPEQWDAALVRVRREIERIVQIDDLKIKPGTTSADPADKSPDLAAAKRYLIEVTKLPAERVNAMPPAQVLLVCLAEFSKEYRDEAFKGFFLPYPQARQALKAASKRIGSVPDFEPARLSKLLLPALLKVKLAEVRLDRKLASVAIIEALRMYAANHGGQLPERLDQIEEVPVPNDPGTGKPFEYHRDGATATLTSRIPGEDLATTGLRYRITVRK